ncbi:hypothetical protein [Dendrosporobacter sp. 1207_IL3150]|uniref:hypothetical protein n=1 Tax=Dendrosporobacter sp. 1207_IL3150 TaxID=3084054 RepID=UPI002FD919E5
MKNYCHNDKQCLDNKQANLEFSRELAKPQLSNNKGCKCGGKCGPNCSCRR